MFVVKVGTMEIVVLSVINKKDYFIKDQFIRKPNNEGHSICTQYTESIIHLRFRVELFYVRSDIRVGNILGFCFNFDHSWTHFSAFSIFR